MKKEKIEIEYVALEDNELKHSFKTEGDEQALESEDAVMVCCKASTYCLSNNDRFKDDRNKSFPREGLKCDKCGDALVMSNRMWDIFQKNTHNPSAICPKCMFEFIKQNE